jgi:hypothetical protein
MPEDFAVNPNLMLILKAFHSVHGLAGYKA